MPTSGGLNFPLDGPCPPLLIEGTLEGPFAMQELLTVPRALSLLGTEVSHASWMKDPPAFILMKGRM